MTSSDDYKALESKYYMQVVNRMPPVLVRGEGTRVFDNDGKSYLDYSIGITATWVGLDWTAAYIGTDIKQDDCFPSTTPPDGSGDKACKGNAVLSVAKSF